jgi:hypothetical protein
VDVSIHREQSRDYFLKLHKTTFRLSFVQYFVYDTWRE